MEFKIPIGQLLKGNVNKQQANLKTNYNFGCLQS